MLFRGFLGGGGELKFSKVIRDVFPPPMSTSLIRSLECQEKGGVWGGKNFGEPYGDIGLVFFQACSFRQQAHKIATAGLQATGSFLIRPRTSPAA